MKNHKNFSLILAGDAGSGIQFIGDLFVNTCCVYKKHVLTYSKFPSEIRPPKNFLFSVSSFVMNFSNDKIDVISDYCDLLIVFNAASLKKFLPFLKKRGIIVIDSHGFSLDKLLKAGYKQDPIISLKKFYNIYKFNFFQETLLNLKKYKLSNSFIVKLNSLFVLGFLHWMCNFSINNSICLLKKKKIELLNINIEIIQKGYSFAKQHYCNDKSSLENITNKSLIVTGNEAISLGLKFSSQKAQKNIFYASYPITPASSIHNFLYKNMKKHIKMFQSEDEISSVCSAIGASYAGDIGVTSTSGPGFCLMQESIGLAVILEIPLIIINVQRCGPSTGIPTKTEQADLMQALYGRNGESPVPVLSCKSPSDCFDMSFLSVKIAIEYMTPVILLSESCLSNSFETLNICEQEENNYNIQFNKFHNITLSNSSKFHPYIRNKNNVRPWVVPGTEKFEHSIGSLEKHNITGEPSSDSKNHKLMIKLRQQKIQNISSLINKYDLFDGSNNGLLLIIGWGSTYGVIQKSVKILRNFYLNKISHFHMTCINPVSNKIDDFIYNFKKILIPETNNGQLVHIIRSKYLVNAKSLNKLDGNPFSSQEIIKFVLKIIQ